MRPPLSKTPCTALPWPASRNRPTAFPGKRESSSIRRTCALPTAELAREGTPSYLIGGEGGGVKKIATVLNITRLYNACCAVGFMRRGLALARDYATRRRPASLFKERILRDKETRRTLRS